MHDNKQIGRITNRSAGQPTDLHGHQMISRTGQPTDRTTNRSTGPPTYWQDHKQICKMFNTGAVLIISKFAGSQAIGRITQDRQDLTISVGSHNICIWQHEVTKMSPTICRTTHISAWSQTYLQDHQHIGMITNRSAGQPTDRQDHQMIDRTWPPTDRQDHQHIGRCPTDLQYLQHMGRTLAGLITNRLAIPHTICRNTKEAEGTREKEEGRREKGEGRREKGEGDKQKRKQENKKF